MTEQQAIEWALSHQDDDDLDQAELEAAFTALYGHAPDAEEKQFLWSHVCAQLPDDREAIAPGDEHYYRPR